MSKVYFENIPFNQYLVSLRREDYDTAIKFGIVEAKDVFNIGDLMEFTFGEVKDIQYLVNYGCSWKDFLEWIAKAKKIELEIIGSTPIFDVVQGRQYIVDQVSKVNQMESKNLGHEPSVDEQRADISRFNKFKTFPQFDQLTKGKLWKIKKIRSMSYMECFTKLYYEATKAAYQIDYNRVMTRKNKHKHG